MRRSEKSRAAIWGVAAAMLLSMTACKSTEVQRRSAPLVEPRVTWGTGDTARPSASASSSQRPSAPSAVVVPPVTPAETGRSSGAPRTAIAGPQPVTKPLIAVAPSTVDALAEEGAEGERKTIGEAGYVSVIQRPAKTTAAERSSEMAPRSADPVRQAPERQAPPPSDDEERTRTQAPNTASASTYIRRPARYGALAYLVESVQCKAAGEAWLRFYEGMVTDLGDEGAQYQLGRRISLWYDPSSAGVNAEDWFCVPKRKFCYNDVTFTQWDGKYEAGDRLDVDYADLENSEGNLLEYAASLAKWHCGG